MHIYLAGSESAPYNEILHRAKIQSRLVSYIYVRANLDLWVNVKFERLFLDSGAFTAFTKGATIDIEDYANVIRYIRPTHYANLDAIGDYDTTQQNQKRLEKMGLAPLPVVHFGNSEQQLRSVFKKYEYVCVGGLVPYSRLKKKLYSYLDFVFAIAKDYWPIKIHLFGITSEATLNRYPAYSSDSSSWLSTARFGAQEHPDMCDKISAMRAKTVCYKARTQVAAKSYSEMEKRVTKIWQSRGITWE